MHGFQGIFTLEPRLFPLSRIGTKQKFRLVIGSRNEPLDLLVSFSKVCTKILDSDFKGGYRMESGGRCSGLRNPKKFPFLGERVGLGC